MSARRVLDRKSVRVQMTLDLETLEMLDEICELHPDLNSRSAAIRWCVRIGVNNLCNHENNRKKEKRR